MQCFITYCNLLYVLYGFLRFYGPAHLSTLFLGVTVHLNLSLILASSFFSSKNLLNFHCIKLSWLLYMVYLTIIPQARMGFESI